MRLLTEILLHKNKDDCFLDRISGISCYNYYLIKWSGFHLINLML